MIESLEADEKTAENGFFAKHAKIGIKNREISRLNRSRLYGMVRRIFKSIGRRVFGDNQHDIFYLTIDEVFSHNFDRKLIENRKAEYEKYAKLPCQNRIVLRDGVPENERENGVASGVLNGTGTSPGVFEGQAVVLSYPDIDADVNEKIIVTKTTDPGWVFLMCRAKAIVAEKGSIMSHTSIVARELGIPAVVGVENAASLIKTGDILRLDANAGRVTIV
jgi:pyruvate,water dikinase